MTVAPIYSFTEDAGRAESAAWAKFSAAKDGTEFCASWLAILCMQIGRVGGGLLLLGPDKDGSYVPAAVWPHAGRDMQYLSPAAERALTERRGIVLTSDGLPPPTRDQRSFVGYPIEVSGALHGAVVLDIAPSAEMVLQRALRPLHWASAWRSTSFASAHWRSGTRGLGRLALAMDIVATAMQQRHFAASALAVANELASRLACDRVAWASKNRAASK